MEEAEVTRYGVFDMQVCVPEQWSDRKVVQFAELKYPSGTTAGWKIRLGGDPDLGDDPERNPCKSRSGFVHIMLDA